MILMHAICDRICETTSRVKVPSPMFLGSPESQVLVPRLEADCIDPQQRKSKYITKDFNKQFQDKFTKQHQASYIPAN